MLPAACAELPPGVDLADDLGWRARDDCLRWDVAGHHGARGDHGALADRHPLQDDCPGADPGAILQDHRGAHRLLHSVHRHGVEVVVEYLGVPGDGAARSDTHAFPHENLREAVDVDVVAELQQAGVHHDACPALHRHDPLAPQSSFGMDPQHGGVPVGRDPERAEADPQGRAVGELDAFVPFDDGRRSDPDRLPVRDRVAQPRREGACGRLPPRAQRPDVSGVFPKVVDELPVKRSDMTAETIAESIHG